MSDKDVKTVRVAVIAEEGWTFNGETRKHGTEWDIKEDHQPRIQSFIDDGTLEVVVPMRAIDAKRQSEIASQVVKEAMTEFRKEQSKQIKVRDLYQDEPEYKEKGGFNSLSDFCVEVYQRDTNKRPSEKLQKWEVSDEAKAATGMGETVGADGGALVPTAFRDQLLSTAIEESVVFSRATFVPMASNAIEIPAVDVTSHASNLFGGVLAYWGSEGTAPTATKPALSKVKLSLNSLKALAYVTDELMEDSAVSLEGILPSMFSRALSYQMDEKFLNGNGAGCPLGIQDAPCTVEVAKESGQSAATIVTNNLTKMWSRLHPSSQANAVWVTNIDTFPELANLTIAVGSGGSVVGILNNQTLQGRPVMNILGAPVIFTEKTQTVGTAGDIMLCDFSQYVIGGKSASGQTMQSSIHLKFDQFETAFRISQRMDGQPWWRSALTPRNGSSNTLSPFVKLATRA